MGANPITNLGTGAALGAIAGVLVAQWLADGGYVVSVTACTTIGGVVGCILEYREKIGAELRSMFSPPPPTVTLRPGPLAGPVSIADLPPTPPPPGPAAPAAPAAHLRGWVVCDACRHVFAVGAGEREVPCPSCRSQVVIG
jgi:hypothetical protein